MVQPPDTVSLRITLRYRDLDEFVSRYAENVSSAGLFLRTKAPKAAGTKIRFELLLADGSRALRGEGVVVTVRTDDKPGMALRFNVLDADSQSVIDRLVAEHGQGALAPTPLSTSFGRSAAATEGPARSRGPGWRPQPGGPSGWVPLGPTTAPARRPAGPSGSVLPRRASRVYPDTGDLPVIRSDEGDAKSRPVGEPLPRRRSSVSRPWTAQSPHKPETTDRIRLRETFPRLRREMEAPSTGGAPVLPPLRGATPPPMDDEDERTMRLDVDQMRRPLPRGDTVIDPPRESGSATLIARDETAEEPASGVGEARVSTGEFVAADPDERGPTDRESATPLVFDPAEGPTVGTSPIEPRDLADVVMETARILARSPSVVDDSPESRTTDFEVDHTADLDSPVGASARIPDVQVRDPEVEAPARGSDAELADDDDTTRVADRASDSDALSSATDPAEATEGLRVHAPGEEPRSSGASLEPDGRGPEHDDEVGASRAEASAGAVLESAGREHADPSDEAASDRTADDSAADDEDGSDRTTDDSAADDEDGLDRTADDSAADDEDGSVPDTEPSLGTALSELADAIRAGAPDSKASSSALQPPDLDSSPFDEPAGLRAGGSVVDGEELWRNREPEPAEEPISEATTNADSDDIDPDLSAMAALDDAGANAPVVDEDQAPSRADEALSEPSEEAAAVAVDARPRSALNDASSVSAVEIDVAEAVAQPASELEAAWAEALGIPGTDPPTSAEAPTPAWEDAETLGMIQPGRAARAAPDADAREAQAAAVAAEAGPATELFTRPSTTEVRAESPESLPAWTPNASFHDTPETTSPESDDELPLETGDDSARGDTRVIRPLPAEAPRDPLDSGETVAASPFEGDDSGDALRPFHEAEDDSANAIGFVDDRVGALGAVGKADAVTRSAFEAEVKALARGDRAREDSAAQSGLDEEDSVVRSEPLDEDSTGGAIDERAAAAPRAPYEGEDSAAQSGLDDDEDDAAEQRWFDQGDEDSAARGAVEEEDSVARSGFGRDDEDSAARGEFGREDEEDSAARGEFGRGDEEDSAARGEFGREDEEDSAARGTVNEEDSIARSGFGRVREEVSAARSGVHGDEEDSAARSRLDDEDDSPSRDGSATRSRLDEEDDSPSRGGSGRAREEDSAARGAVIGDDEEDSAARGAVIGDDEEDSAARGGFGRDREEDSTARGDDSAARGGFDSDEDSAAARGGFDEDGSPAPNKPYGAEDAPAARSLGRGDAVAARGKFDGAGERARSVSRAPMDDDATVAADGPLSTAVPTAAFEDEATEAYDPETDFSSLNELVADRPDQRRFPPAKVDVPGAPKPVSAPPASAARPAAKIDHDEDTAAIIAPRPAPRAEAALGSAPKPRPAAGARFTPMNLDAETEIVKAYDATGPVPNLDHVPMYSTKVSVRGVSDGTEPSEVVERTRQRAPARFRPAIEREVGAGPIANPEALLSRAREAAFSEEATEVPPERVSALQEVHTTLVRNEPRREERTRPAVERTHRIVGVDLGGRWVRLGVIAQGELELIPASGTAYIPALVASRPGGSLVVGTKARSIFLDDPRRAVSPREVLHAIRGGKIEPELSAQLNVESYEDGRLMIRLGDHRHEFSELLEKFLEALRDAIVAHLSHDRFRVVLSVPNDLDPEARRILQSACRAAGFPIAKLLPEPEALLLAYNLEEQNVSTALLVDVGASHVAVSVAERGEDGFTIAGSSWTNALSARDLDAAVVDLTLDELEKQAGEDHKNDDAARMRLMEAVEFARLDIRRAAAIDLKVTLPAPGGAAGVVVERSIKLPRSRIYQVTEDVVRRICLEVQELLKATETDPRTVGAVIVGGSGGTYPPLVEAISSITLRDPLQAVPPATVFALGLARAGQALERAESASRPDTLNASIGFELSGGRFRPLIPAGTKLPIKLERTYPTTKDFQSDLELKFFQGDAELVRTCTYLGRMHLTGLPKATRGEVKIELTMEVDGDGVLSILLAESSTGVRERLLVPTAQTPGNRRKELSNQRSSVTRDLGPKAEPKRGIFSRLFGLK